MSAIASPNFTNLDKWQPWIGLFYESFAFLRCQFFIQLFKNQLYSADSMSEISFYDLVWSQF